MSLYYSSKRRLLKGAGTPCCCLPSRKSNDANYGPIDKEQLCQWAWRFVFIDTGEKESRRDRRSV